MSTTRGRPLVTNGPDGRHVATVYDVAGQTLCTFKALDEPVVPRPPPVAANCNTWNPAVTRVSRVPCAMPLQLHQQRSNWPSPIQTKHTRYHIRRPRSLSLRPTSPIRTRARSAASSGRRHRQAARVARRMRIWAMTTTGIHRLSSTKRGPSCWPVMRSGQSDHRS